MTKAYNKLSHLAQEVLGRPTPKKYGRLSGTHKIKMRKRIQHEKNVHIEKAKEELREFLYGNDYWKKRPDIEDAVTVLSKAVNIMDGTNKSEEFINHMRNEHRTLQQAMTRLFLAWIKYLSQVNDNEYDERNKASVNIARSIISWVNFLDELDRYHSSQDIQSDSYVQYLEEHKPELEYFVGIVKSFLKKNNNCIFNLPVV